MMVRIGLGWMAVASLSLLLGAAVARNPQVGFLFAIAVVGLSAVAAPAAYWALAALLAAVTFRGLVTLHILPSVATFVDMPIAWGALVVALLKRRGWSRAATIQLRWLAGLIFAVFLSWGFNRSEVLRPFLFLALLGEPFALIAALLLDPPSQRLRRILIGGLFALIAIQVPISVFEFFKLGPADHVQGTLYGSGAGHHTMAAIDIVGAIWLSMRRIPSRARWRLAIVVMLVLLPFAADAKQVIIALPMTILVGNWRANRRAMLLRLFAVACSLVALFVYYPARGVSKHFVSQAASGKGGKSETLKFVWGKLKDDPVSIAVGKGPATTVSRAAFMTTDLLQRPSSPLRILHLKPAEIAIEADAAAVYSSGGASSVNSGISSAIGVLGDTGVAGLGTYATMLAWLILLLRRQRSPEGIAAAAGFAMFAFLGLVFDWWEQPPFSVTLAVLAGLALTGVQGTSQAVAGGA